MKKLLIAGATLSVFVIAPASAEFYGAVGLGAALQSDATVSGPGFEIDLKTDPGMAGSLAVGYQIPAWWHIRAEAEYLMTRGNVKDHPLGTAIQLRSSGMMANVYVPIPTPFVQVYAGGGIGMMQITGFDRSVDIGNYADFKVAYQAIVGVEVELPIIKTLGIEARYLRTNADFPGVEVTADNWLLMLRARF